MSMLSKLQKKRSQYWLVEKLGSKGRGYEVASRSRSRGHSLEAVVLRSQPGRKIEIDNFYQAVKEGTKTEHRRERWMGIQKRGRGFVLKEDNNAFLKWWTRVRKYEVVQGLEE